MGGYKENGGMNESKTKNEWMKVHEAIGNGTEFLHDMQCEVWRWWKWMDFTGIQEDRKKERRKKERKKERKKKKEKERKRKKQNKETNKKSERNKTGKKGRIERRNR